MTATRPHSWIRTGSDNLTTLPELNEKTLLEAIQQRYHGDRIYTDVGDILVAVNPFRSLPLYSEEWSSTYSRPDVNSLAPHIYKVASRAYNAILREKKDQVCVISGESGAGKTESAKFIMHQVMTICRSAGLGQKLQHKITQLNPILEAFGNARTALNDNSSRFGKYIQLVFEPNGRIIGAGLEQYLLEKSRVCVQGEKERNFHIFYYMYAGLAQDRRTQFGLKEPTKHRYLKSYPNVTADCNSEESRESFNRVMKSLEEIGFAEEEIKAILTILSGVILLGDIEFKGADSGEDNAEISNNEAVDAVAKLLELENSEELSFALTTLRTETRGEVVDKHYTVTKAADVRDGLAKALYARMFQWIVARLNAYLQPYPDSDQLNLGILDIFGFENFKENSFEQFCINLANEQLQCYFNHQIFAMEKMELAREGIEELDITYKDNKPVLDLFLSKPIGLLSLLDDQCRALSGTEKGFVQRCKESFGKHSNYKPHRGNAPIFSVKHYAGDVEYQVGGFLEKNKDSLPDSVVSAVKFSSVRLIRTLFLRRSEHTSGSQLRKSILMKSQRSVLRAMSRRKSMRHKKGGRGQKKLLTVGGHFRDSLDQLMERLFAASPHFVRCLKPNLSKQPNNWCSDLMRTQLQYTGMLEAVRVRREGFAYRPFFSCFFNMYRPIAYYFTDQKKKGCEIACHFILDKAGLENWKIGSSRVFLRYYHQEKLQLMLKDIEDKATLIQSTFRGYITRKRTTELRNKQKREKEMMTKFLGAMNTHGQECFPKIVALNRTDNLLAHERFANKREAAPIARVDSYAGLDAQQKNLKRAKKLGIQMVPGLSDAVSSKPRQRLKSVEDERVEHIQRLPDDGAIDSPTPVPRNHSSSPRHLTPEHRARLYSSERPTPEPRARLSSSERSTPEHRARLSSSERPTPEHRARLSSSERSTPEPRVQSSSPGHRTPVARPRSRVIAPSEFSPHNESIPDNSTGQSGQITTPVPTPRKRSPKSRDDSPTHLSKLIPGMTETQIKSMEFPQDAGDVPHFKLHVPVGGAKVLPELGDTSSGSSTNSLEEDQPQTRPIPKPRKSPSPSPRRVMKFIVPSPNHVITNVSTGTVVESVHNLRQPLLSKDSGEISLDFGSDQGATSHNRSAAESKDESDLDFQNRANRENLTDYHETEESVLDFVPNGRPPLHPDYVSDASGRPPRPPDYVSDASPFKSPSRNSPRHYMTGQDSELSTEDLYDRKPSMASNLVNLRILANSVGNLFEEDNSSQKKRHSSSASSENMSPRTSFIEQPPQADKRMNSGRRGFGFGKRKQKYRSRHGSTASNGGDTKYSSESESTTDFLGFYPNLDQDATEDFVLGQPCGTYAVCKEESRSSVEDPEWAHTYNLVLSFGRSFRVFPIISIMTSSGMQFYLENTNSVASFPSLKGLVDFYSKNEVASGVCLLQPRLLAGVHVAAARVPRIPRERGGRLATRRKRSTTKVSVTDGIET